MIPLGMQLQAAGVAFLEASAKHSRAGAITADSLAITEAEIVVETDEDAIAARAWAAAQGIPATVRLATDEEVAEAKAVQW